MFELNQNDFWYFRKTAYNNIRSIISISTYFKLIFLYRIRNRKKLDVSHGNNSITLLAACL